LREPARSPRNPSCGGPTDRAASCRTLGISDGTVKNHLTDILQKRKARDRTHAVLQAIASRFL
jgi:DNA-binding CsgD family transcriptional regulator